MYKIFGKRFLDLFFSLIGGTILLIPILIIIILLRIQSNGPVFFTQKRLGYEAKTFKIYKFRTMLHRKRVSKEQVFPDHPEVTKVGRFLRRFKLDEMPQLFNVLKGDMSIVGPRPCLPELQKKFDKNGKARVEVRPGLFGLADINGGYYLTWPQRWVYDQFYVENISFWLDIKLMLKAIPIILFDEDFYLQRKL